MEATGHEAEGIEAIETGEDPPCIIRDPAKQNVEFKAFCRHRHS